MHMRMHMHTYTYETLPWCCRGVRSPRLQYPVPSSALRLNVCHLFSALLGGRRLGWQNAMDGARSSSPARSSPAWGWASPRFPQPSGTSLPPGVPSPCPRRAQSQSGRTGRIKVVQEPTFIPFLYVIYLLYL